jgi:hypothetical protein
MVGRLLLGHTVRNELGGWGRQVIIRTTPGRLRGEARRLERNLALLEAMGDETDPARLLAYALALEARPSP